MKFYYLSNTKQSWEIKVTCERGKPTQKHNIRWDPSRLAAVPPDIVIPNNTDDPPGQPGCFGKLRVTFAAASKLIYIRKFTTEL